MLVSNPYLRNRDKKVTFKNATLRITDCLQIACVNKQMLTEASVYFLLFTGSVYTFWRCKREKNKRAGGKGNFFDILKERCIFN